MVVVVGLGSLLARGIFPPLPVLIRAGLELDRLIAFSVPGLEAQSELLYPTYVFAMFAVRNKSNTTTSSICRSTCMHISWHYFVFDWPSSFPDVLHPDRY